MSADLDGSPSLGRGNRRMGWSMAALGAGLGLLLGLWSFEGPLAPPSWLGDYGSTARRMVRLGHIALIALGILNILLGRELHSLRLPPRGRRLASLCLNLGNPLLPLTLFAGALHPPLKYLTALPATLVVVALALVAWGCRRGGT